MISNNSNRLSKAIGLFLLASWGIIGLSFSQSEAGLSEKYLQKTFRFENIGLEQGLSVSTARAMVMDQNGFVWIATNDGLNRYDGQNIKVFRHDPTDSTSLSNNYVRTIFLDKKGTVWVGTWWGGLCRFLADLECFQCYQNLPEDATSLSHNNINTISEAPDGQLWVGTWEGLNRFDQATGTSQRFAFPDHPEQLENISVNTVIEDPLNASELWIGTYQAGLIRYNLTTGKTTYFTHNAGQKSSISSNDIRQIIASSDHAIWLATSHGVDVFDRKEQQFERWSANRSTHFPSQDCFSIQEGNDGNFWFGTENGLVLWRPESELFQTFKHQPDNPFSLGHNAILDIFEDPQQRIWLGTRSGGLSKYDPTAQRFILFQSIPSEPNSLVDNTIWALTQDQQGSIWVGTQNGVNQIDQKSGKVFLYNSSQKGIFKLPFDIIGSLFIDTDGSIWIGSWGKGIVRFIPDQPEKQLYWHSQSGFGLTNDNIRYINRGPEGNLWIGTHGGGLHKYDSATKRLVAYQYLPEKGERSLSDNNIKDMKWDRKGYLWIATQLGLNRFDPKTASAVFFTHEPENPNSLSHNYINCIQVAHDGTLWLGTQNGLDHFDPVQNQWRNFGPEQGLSSATVHTVLEDEKSHLWISTNRGLDYFDPNSGKVKHFTTEDGLQGNEFNSSVGFASEEGMLFFGGVKGFNAFHPEHLPINQNEATVRLTELKISFQTIQPHPGSVLPSHIDRIKSLELDHFQNNLAFQFASVNHTLPAKNSHAYRLDPIDKKWNEIGSQRTLFFNNLEPGHYTLRIKAANSDGIWNPSEKQLAIIIRPPWYLSWWAITLLYSSIGLVFFLVYRIRVSVIKQQKEVLELQVKDRTVEIQRKNAQLEQQKEEIQLQANHLKEVNQQLVELDRFKQNFTGMIVHDLKNPLNALLNLRETAAPNYLEEVNHLGRQMQHLVLNLLDVQKFEDASIKLNKEAIFLPDLIQEAVHDIAYLLPANQLSLSLEIAEVFIYADRNLAERMLINLLTNAIKFSHPQGTITLKAQMKNQEMIEIHVMDQGKGIPAEMLPNIFDRFFQVESTTTGKSRSTGLGLTFCKLAAEAHQGEIGVSSAPGKGADFWLTLPAAQSNGQPITASVLRKDLPSFRFSDLTATDKETLRPFLPKFRNTEIYVVSEIEDLLSQIDFSGSSGLKNWELTIRKALKEMDEANYKAALSVLDED